MDAIDYWRFCDELMVTQAVFLIIGEDPGQVGEYKDGWDPRNRPEGYIAVLTAIQNAILSNRLAADVVNRNLQYTHPDEGHPIASVDWSSTRISVEGLKKWLVSRGAAPDFFFPEVPESVEYLDRQHPNFSPKLAAAINAWKAVVQEKRVRESGRSVKSDLVRWLNLHAPDYGLSDEEGKPNNTAIDEVAKVANWDTKGGAPKTPAN